MYKGRHAPTLTGVCPDVWDMQVPVATVNQIQQKPNCSLWVNLVLERFPFAGNLFLTLIPF